MPFPDIIAILAGFTFLAPSVIHLAAIIAFLGLSIFLPHVPKVVVFRNLQVSQIGQFTATP